MCWLRNFVPFLVLVCTVISPVFSRGTCPVVKYTGRFNESDYVKDYALLGRSYKNLTTSTVQECFSVCSYDCRCVSYQLSGRRCELIDDDRHTAPDLFKPLPGYKYYELKQQVKKSNSVGCSSQCNNGCCHYSEPCLNGGTCIETCQKGTHKFQCECPQGFSGRVCQFNISCSAYSTMSLPNTYLIQTTNGNRLKVMYCDMTSEPGMVWTLIESFAYSRREKYRKKPLTEEFPSNEESFNWKDYRLSRPVMQQIRSNATHWRATCNYDIVGLIKTDYVEGLLSELDILAYQAGHRCLKVLYIDIRGKSCSNCTSHFRQDNRTHILIDSHGGSGLQCEWDGKNECSQEAEITGCDYFGKYTKFNPKFRCSSSENSTTQWWLGTATQITQKDDG